MVRNHLSLAGQLGCEKENISLHYSPRLTCTVIPHITTTALKASILIS